MASSSSQPDGFLHVTAFLDYGNCFVPDSYDLGRLKERIQLALQTRNENYILDKIIAVGPTGKKYNKMRRFNDFSFVIIPVDNIRCDYRCNRLVVCDPTNKTTERAMMKTDAADLYMMKDIYMNVLQGLQNILVITDDADFAEMIISLHGEGKTILLARNETCSRELRVISGCTKGVWIWEEMYKGQRYL